MDKETTNIAMADYDRVEVAESQRMPLTRMQCKVARLVAQGCSNAEIAEALDIDVYTAKNHISDAMARLGLHNRTQLAIYALKSALIALADIELPAPPDADKA